MTASRGRAALRVLVTYETVFAASALAGGIGLITAAPGFRLPTGVLAPWGLASWVLPGLALIVVVGGSLGWAAVAAWRGSRVQLAVLGWHEPVQWAALVLLVLLVLLCRCVQAAVT